MRWYLFESDEFNVENEGGIGWNDTGVTLLAVCIVWGAGQLGPFADRHL